VLKSGPTPRRDGQTGNGYVKNGVALQKITHDLAKAISFSPKHLGWPFLLGDGPSNLTWSPTSTSRWDTMIGRASARKTLLVGSP
jgi:hypothetical protein